MCRCGLPAVQYVAMVTTRLTFYCVGRRFSPGAIKGDLSEPVPNQEKSSVGTLSGRIIQDPVEEGLVMVLNQERDRLAVEEEEEMMMKEVHQ